MRKTAKAIEAAVSQDPPKSKDAILAAALKAFARDGFDGASMPKIAKMAQIAPPLIHYYFGSKENLWKDTVDHSLGRLRREASAIHSATRALAPLDRLRTLLQAITQFAAHWPDHFAMIVAEARSNSDRFAWTQEHYTGPLMEELLSILRDARDSGAIVVKDVEQLAFILIGGILLYFSMRPRPYPVEDLDRMSAEFTEFMFGMFMNGVGA